MLKKISDLKGILKVGMIVKRGHFGCNELDEHPICEITESNDEYFSINGCCHGWEANGDLDVLDLDEKHDVFDSDPVYPQNITINPKTKIIEWLYIHEDDFRNKQEWKKDFIEFLDEIL
jgi:hypothetical protein